MKSSVTRNVLSICGIFVFCFLLTACGGGTATATPPAPTTAPTATPTTVPTPTPAVTLTTFTGDGYTIGYPTSWTEKKAGTVVQLSRDDNTSLIVETAESPSGVSTTGSVQGGLAGLKSNAKNFQTKDVPATVTVNNIEWQQGAATADDPTTGAHYTVYVLASKFPNNPNKLVAIIYNASTSEFDKLNTDDFQPILQSFKFS
jgi:hypothetical protein